MRIFQPLHSAAGEVQSDKIKTACKDGILRVTLPKTEETKKKEIKTKVEYRPSSGKGPLKERGPCRVLMVS